MQNSYFYSFDTNILILMYAYFHPPRPKLGKDSLLCLVWIDYRAIKSIVLQILDMENLVEGGGARGIFALCDWLTIALYKGYGRVGLRATCSLLLDMFLQRRDWIWIWIDSLDSQRDWRLRERERYYIGTQLASGYVLAL